MGKKRKPYAKKYSMLNNIHWIPTEISEKENQQRVESLAQQILSAVNEDYENKDCEKIEQDLEGQLGLKKQN